MAPEAVPERIADRIAVHSGTRAGRVRVAVDGPPPTDPHTLAAALVEPLRLRGRPVLLVRDDSFWRDAALRLEYGREDAESYPDWLDVDALRREVLDPLPGGAYLPSLRDPATNRSTREPARAVAPGTVLVVSGQFLLGRGLPFDVTVHLALSPAALRRQTPAERAWTLPAFTGYQATTRPDALADLVVKLDDPQHPAVRR